MSEPSLSEIAKVPAGSAFKDRQAAPRSAAPLGGGPYDCGRGTAEYGETGLLRPRKNGRNTVNTFFERRAGTSNRGTLERTVDLIHVVCR